MYKDGKWAKQILLQIIRLQIKLQSSGQMSLWVLFKVEPIKRYKLDFVVDWLNGNSNENGNQDMGKTVNDKLYFLLSDDRRKKETREADCTNCIEKLMTRLLEK